jgi:hypothetical protein
MTAAAAVYLNPANLPPIPRVHQASIRRRSPRAGRARGNPSTAAAVNNGVINGDIISAEAIRKRAGLLTPHDANRHRRLTRKRDFSNAPQHRFYCHFALF